MPARKKDPNKKLSSKLQVQLTDSEYQRIEALISEELESVSKVGRHLILKALDSMENDAQVDAEENAEGGGA